MNCNQINQHDRDSLIRFDEASHTYSVHGQVYKSVTTLIGECFEQFDADYWAAKKAPSMGVTPEELKAMWERKGEEYDTKYLYVCHAELNAILNSRDSNLEGCRIYVALFPCNECAKAIIQSGIKEVVYLCDKYADTTGVKASKRMFEAATAAS